MKSSQRRQLIGILFSILFFFVCLETGLRILDPLGTQTLARGNRLLYGNSTSTERGYIPHAGTYDVGRWQFTILADGTRFLPDTRDADCTIAFIGDSVTFGYGVNDADTFANILAGQLEDVQFINAARPGYNVEYISYLPDQYPANGYIWLIFVNDASPELPDSVFQANNVPQFAMKRALDAFLNDWRWSLDAALFHRYAAGLFARSDVRVFAFSDTALESELPDNATRIAPYTTTVSLADNHPDRLGHQQIADAMRPYLIEFEEGVCNG